MNTTKTGRLAHGEEGGNGKQGEMVSEYIHAPQSTWSRWYLPGMSIEGTWFNNRALN